jgi:hypothetical protein
METELKEVVYKCQFTQEQKKWIVRLKTSEKHVSGLIGPRDTKDHYHRCCLGVYAGCCGISPTVGERVLKFESGSSDIIFMDCEKFFLQSSNGHLRNTLIKTDGYSFSSLAGINDCDYYDFSHEFISKFLFTMPERVFKNFDFPNRKEFQLNDFVEEVEKLAEVKEYKKVTEEWEKEFGGI